ncbi:Casein kinase II subunit alpha' [Tritrichomonas foetus]|uniref:non-specific serine/threonine protein kinase n=1 Tax=Tritrichomonas foetus TaxID=1144522 RepID=A0A1J4JVC9_9EUKA|nr:Casein kinase II subunit alpha' [Tritrichomonas foetus]|eukprot:OHT03081.1 Casein kinase II subunit alpha' [Tritrichomonas foetus]
MISNEKVALFFTSNVNNKQKINSKIMRDEFVDDFVDSLEIDGLEIYDRIGYGNFGSVFLGCYHDQDVAVKVMLDNENALRHEKSILQKIKGCKNAIRIIDADFPYPIILMEYKESIPESALVSEMNLEKIKIILKSILECLAEVHECGVVHQDVKLSNILVSDDFSEVTLTDWGCAHFLTDNLTPFIGSRLYRSPEMLIGAKNYREKGDIWAVGVIILNLLTNGNLPWNATNDAKQLVEMVKIYGKEKILAYAERLEVKIRPNIMEMFDDSISKSIEESFAENKKELQDELLLDLMNKLLTFDMNERPTARQALQHQFFQV